MPRSGCADEALAARRREALRGVKQTFKNGLALRKYRKDGLSWQCFQWFRIIAATGLPVAIAHPIPSRSHPTPTIAAATD